MEQIKNNKNKIWKCGFTLVELIIVISILAILATIAFVSFQDYSKSARDGKRLATLKSIETWLLIYNAKTGDYPLPDSSMNITGTWWNLLIHQWVVWDGVKGIIKLSGDATDPIDSTNYVYSTNASNTAYQLWAYLEEENDLLSLVPQSYAADYTKRHFYTIWKMVWILTNADGSPLEGGANLDGNSTNYTVYFPQNKTTSSWSDLVETIVNNQTLNSSSQSGGGDGNFVCNVSDPTSAEYFTYENVAWWIEITWSLDLLRGGNITHLVIPCTIDGEKVVSIADNAFTEDGANLFISVVIPNTVTNIGSSAFNYHEGLTSIVLPENLKELKNSVFAANGLTSFTIPGSVEHIWESAFWYSSHLTNLIIENWVKTIWKQAFACSGFTDIVIPSSVEKIETDAFNYDAFWGCSNLNHITFQWDSVELVWNPFGSSGFSGGINTWLQWDWHKTLWNWTKG